jgi:pilus assembly protein CpaB
MRAKSAVLLLLALGCGLVAAIGVTQVINRDVSPRVETGDTASIFVALRDITPGELITPQLVRLEPWPKAKVPEGSLSQMEKVEGCRARTEILQGEPIREKKLLGKGANQQTPTDYIPKGYRVVGVKVDLVSGAGLIRPGDRVDVMVHLKRNANNDIPENRTQTILQDIKVFAVDDTFKIDPATKEEDSTAAKTISLLVTPQQAERLILASQLGKVQLVMRSPGDNEVAKTVGVTPLELIGKTSAADRTKDETDSAPTSAKADGLFGLLDRMRSKTPTAATPPPPQSETWSVRMLQGSEVSDVTMEEANASAGATGWRVNTPNATSGSKPEPATKEPAVAPQPSPLPPPTADAAGGNDDAGTDSDTPGDAGAGEPNTN